MRKQKQFDLPAIIADRGFDPELLDLLEATRPLKISSIARASKKVKSIKEVIRGAKARAEFMPFSFWFASGVAAMATIAPSQKNYWAKAVMLGISYRMYQGRYSEQDAYTVMCLAAGSCLRAPEAEPFRLALSLITKAGLRPPIGDESPAFEIKVSPIPRQWEERATVYGALGADVKGGSVAECLAVGIGCLIIEGAIDNTLALEVFRSTDPWRASSPIPALLAAE